MLEFNYTSPIFLFSSLMGTVAFMANAWFPYMIYSSVRDAKKKSRLTYVKYASLMDDLDLFHSFRKYFIALLTLKRLL